MMVQIFKVQEIILLMSKQDATAREPCFNDTIRTMNRNKNRKLPCLKILTITAQLNLPFTNLSKVYININI